MAKKAISTFKTGTSKQFTRVIKMVKSPKSGAYIFEEEVVNKEHIKDYLTEH